MSPTRLAKRLWWKQDTWIAVSMQLTAPQASLPNSQVGALTKAVHDINYTLARLS